MSGLRENLGDWALGHGASLAETLGSTEGAARVAIRRRRRRRAVAVATTAVAAAVGVGALASGMRGADPLPPAANSEAAVDGMGCGSEWTLQPGVTTYFPGADYYFDDPSGEWVLTYDDGSTHADVDTFTAGYGDISWRGEVKVRGTAIARASIVAVRDGVVVGSYEDTYHKHYSFGSPDLTSSAPYPGQCGDAIGDAGSGPVTYHLVITVEEVGSQERTAATIVDPSGSRNVTIDGLEDWVEASALPPAELKQPQGDVYQAFVVPYPSGGSCTPLLDQRAAGSPTVADLEYPVTIPGVQPLTNGMWAGDPVVVREPDGEWAFRPGSAWLIADDTGGMPEASLSWSDDGTTLSSGEGYTPTGYLDCAFTAQLSEIKGAVFLVVDGVDWSAVLDANPNLAYLSRPAMTWVYLGQAG